FDTHCSSLISRIQLKLIYSSVSSTPYSYQLYFNGKYGIHLPGTDVYISSQQLDIITHIVKSVPPAGADIFGRISFPEHFVRIAYSTSVIFHCNFQPAVEPAGVKSYFR